MGLTRRRFVQIGSMSLLASACAPVWSTRSPSAPGRVRDRPDPLLVVVFLRGAADGLHLVPPLGDRHYTQLRGAVALRDGLPFVEGFGLHPAMIPLAPVVTRGDLAVVHAVGSAHPTRSHFEAQDVMERGGPGSARVTTGWMARALREAPAESALASVALTPLPPLTLRGAGALTMGDPFRLRLGGASETARRALADMYRPRSGDPVTRAGARALSALAEFEDAMRREAADASGSRRSAGRSLTRSANDLLALDHAGVSVRAAFLESAGWDTHARQGTDSGPLVRRIGDLATAMATLSEGTRTHRDLLLVVMTEFGRTVRPNGSNGTDHGHGSVMFVVGPRVRGGLYGAWPGLDPRDLYEGRDLPVTTDYRRVLIDVLHGHLGTAPPPDTFSNLTAPRLGIVA